MSVTNLPQFSYIMNKPEVGERVKQSHIRFQPMGWFNSGATAQPNNYVLFNFRTDGFLDPHTLYLHIEVDASEMPDNCLYQIDNSAQSIIGQYIARVNGTELIRIQEYDEIAALLYDLHIGIDERDNRVGEGVGRNRVQHRMLSNQGPTPSTTFAMVDFPSWPTAWIGWNSDYNAPVMGERGVASLANGVRPYRVFSGLAPDDYESTALTSNYSSYLDFFNLEDSQGCEYPNINVGVAGTALTGYANYGWGYDHVATGGPVRVNTEAAVGTLEHYLSKYVLKPTILGGLPVFERSVKANFQIPLLCPIFGALSDHGKLLPMRLFDNLELEFALNQYAFFVGGVTNATYRANSSLSNVSATTVWKDSTKKIVNSRTKWKVTKFEIVGELTFPTATDSTIILNRLQGAGLSIDFKAWYLGPKNKYAGGTSLNSTIQINNGFNSLNLLAFYFQPADYELYTHTRKHKRISNNLTSMQLRIGTDYIPSLPVAGHAGCLRPSSLGTNKGNYVEFFVHTMKAFGKWLKVGASTLLNPTNYTLNTVGYQVDSTGLTNIDLAYDMSLFWENNIVPRSVFAFDLEKFDVTQDVKSGTDTTLLRPFDLLLTNDNSSITHSGIGHTGIHGEASSNTSTAVISDTAFPRSFYLYIWLYYDAKIMWNGAEGWKAEGRI